MKKKKKIYLNVGEEYMQRKTSRFQQLMDAYYIRGNLPSMEKKKTKCTNITDASTTTN